MALTPFRALAWLTGLLFGIRLYAANRVGFGDAEALYASYAWHPQPAYLDHPGLIGAVARFFGEGGAPAPVAAHNVSAGVATLVPLLGALAAWLAGASRDRAPLAGLALLAAPEITVGLFGFTPDLLLCPLWLLTLGLVAAGIRETGARSLFAFLAAGATMGLACDAKVSGALLPLSLIVFLATPPGRAASRTLGPWLALAMCALLVLPVAVYEARHGYPLFQHRLVATQAEAGVSLRNLGALVGGQLGYLSPVVAVAAVLLFLSLRRHPADAGGTWLLVVSAMSLAGLGALCLWSRVAEPHWLAPAWLALPLHLARRPASPIAPRLGRWALVTGLLVSAVAHVWVLSDLAPRLLGRYYEARYDLANDLYVWSRILPAVKRERQAAETQYGAAPVLVAPHWIIAAQLAAALERGAPITTVAPVADDFQTFLPSYLWDRHPVVLWVTDDRFPEDRPAALAHRASAGVVTVNVLRGGRVVRRARLEVLLLEGSARVGAPPAGERSPLTPSDDALSAR